MPNSVRYIENKTIMVFNPDEALEIPTSLMGGRTLERVSTLNTLGVLCSEKGNWDTKDGLP
jgi:hypothetical protein